MFSIGASTPNGQQDSPESCAVATGQDAAYLSDCSPKDRPWDIHRASADRVAVLYAQDSEFQRLAARMSDCSGLLLFARLVDQDTGEFFLKLRGARFCRVRHCPVCQWRRSMMWRAKFFQALPALQESFPGARWVFLTLTVRNCALVDLRDTLKAMSAAWNRLRLRSEFAPVLGWVRTTEVTRSADGTAHPHFHCLLMVKPSYFTGRQYVRQARWAEVWRECARLDYAPVVDVRAVKSRDGNAFEKALCETLKYSVKPADLEADAAWLLELTRQLHKMRFMATGGALKDILKPLEAITNEDMVLADSGAPEAPEAPESPTVAFSWDRPVERYRRTGSREGGE